MVWSSYKWYGCVCVCMYVCILTEAVNSVFLQVGNNDTVKVGSEEELVASAEGR